MKKYLSKRIHKNERKTNTENKTRQDRGNRKKKKVVAGKNLPYLQLE